MFSKMFRTGPWLVGRGNSSSSGSSCLLIPFHGSVSMPWAITGEPGGPADRTFKVQSEVLNVEGVGVDWTSRTFT